MLQNRQNAIDRRGSRAAIVELLALVSLSLGAFAAFWLGRGAESARQYAAGYLVELGLSADNVVLFLVVFERFGLPGGLRRRALAWGLAGAVILRGAALVAGFALVERFHAVFYIIGAFLVLAGARLMFGPKRSAAEGLISRADGLLRRARISRSFHAGRFFAVEGGRRVATLFLAVVLVVEAVDLVFAADSLPAVLAVTKDPLVAWVSNVFAVLALRMLVLALGSALPRFPRLHGGIAAVLVFAGAKMLAAPWIEVPTSVALAAIGGILLVSVLPVPRR